MTIHYRAKGIVSGRDDRGESDRVFTIFTDNFGKLEVFGKAIRKIASKLKSGIDIFSLSEIEFIQGKSQKTLTDAVFIKRFENISSDPEKFKIAGKIIGVLNDFVNGQEKDKTLFCLLSESLDELNDNTFSNKNYNLIYYYFLWNFFSGQGYQPEVYKCVACQAKLNPYGIYFSNKDGGIICKSCSVSDRTARRINSDIVKILRLLSEKDWQIISKLKIENNSQKLLEEISNNYYFYLLSK